MNVLIFEYDDDEQFLPAWRPRRCMRGALFKCISTLTGAQTFAATDDKWHFSPSPGFIRYFLLSTPHSTPFFLKKKSSELKDAPLTLCGFIFFLICLFINWAPFYCRSRNHFIHNEFMMPPELCVRKWFAWVWLPNFRSHLLWPSLLISHSHSVAKCVSVFCGPVPVNQSHIHNNNNNHKRAPKAAMNFYSGAEMMYSK